jgi:transposase-like protein
MYLAGVSVRRVEDITQALWGTRVSASTVSDLNQKIYGKIDEWRERPLVGDFPYVFLDGLWLKRSWGGEVKNVSVLVAIGVAQSGYREILALTNHCRIRTRLPLESSNCLVLHLAVDRSANDALQ